MGKRADLWGNSFPVVINRVFPIQTPRVTSFEVVERIAVSDQADDLVIEIDSIEAIRFARVAFDFHIFAGCHCGSPYLRIG